MTPLDFTGFLEDVDELYGKYDVEVECTMFEDINRPVACFKIYRKHTNGKKYCVYERRFEMSHMKRLEVIREIDAALKVIYAEIIMELKYDLTRT